MKILFAASELAPGATTGGLGEVLAALPRFLANMGHDVAVVVPGYPRLMEDAVPVDVQFSLPIGDSLQPVTILERPQPDGPQLLLIHNDALFGRPGLYGDANAPYPDNALRFILFSRAVVELAKRLDPSPEIIHVHDWQTALVPILVRDQSLPIRTVLTIHNASYQGSFDVADFGFTNLPSHWMSPSGLEFYGGLNLLKGGILAADALTTVSTAYRSDLLNLSGSIGMEPILRGRENVFEAIPNGVDPERWDPATSPGIAERFSADSLRGKSVCRSSLLLKLGLRAEPTGPVFAMLGRLADQKGFDLLLPLLPRLLANNCRLIIAGDGDPALRRDVLVACRQHPDKLRFVSEWDADFPKQLFAAADVLLMPSHFEPSGLTPLHAMRFGAVPVAHATGGLLENLRDFDPGRGSGNALLYFKDSGDSLWDTLLRAIALFSDAAAWQVLLQNAMRSNYPWDRSAAALDVLYKRLIPA